MNNRERILTTLSYREPDRIPLDFGATPVTGIHVLAIENMRKYWGLPYSPVKVTEPYQMLGEIEDDLASLLELDAVGVQPRNTMFGFANEGWKAWRAPWGQELLVPENFNVTYNDQGDVLIYPEGDTSVPPCAKMPVNGFFFDALPRQDPLDHNNLNVEDNLEEFAEITTEDLDYFTEEIEKAHASGKAVVANFGGTGLGDIALVPAMQLKHPKGIRDVTEWYMATLMHPDYVKEIFAYQTDIALKNLEKLLEFAPGYRVLHDSWGPGRIRAREADALIIDFKGKPGHRMSLKIARNALTVIPADDLRVLWMEDPDRVRQMVRTQRTDLAYLAIRELGGKATTQELRRRLTAEIIPTSSWSTWWKDTRTLMEEDEIAPVEDILIALSDGEFWVATDAGAFVELPGVGWDSVDYPSKFEGARVNCMVISGSLVWSGTSKGLGRLDYGMLKRLRESGG